MDQSDGQTDQLMSLSKTARTLLIQLNTSHREWATMISHHSNECLATKMETKGLNCVKCFHPGEVPWECGSSITLPHFIGCEFTVHPSCISVPGGSPWLNTSSNVRFVFTVTFISRFECVSSFLIAEDNSWDNISSTRWRCLDDLFQLYFNDKPSAALFVY